MTRLTRFVAAGKCAAQTTPLAVCLLLSLVSIALWTQSYSTGHRYIFRANSTENNRSVLSTYHVLTSGGGVRFARSTVASADAEVVASAIGTRGTGAAPRGLSTVRPASYPRLYGSGDDSILTAIGIQFTSFRDQSDDGVDTTDTRLTLPWWMIVLTLAAYPTFKYVVCVVRRQREDRIALGLCPRCGEPVNELIPACRGCDLPVGILTHA